jgi:hypothetical protein
LGTASSCLIQKDNIVRNPRLIETVLALKLTQRVGERLKAALVQEGGAVAETIVQVQPLKYGFGLHFPIPHGAHNGGAEAHGWTASGAFSNPFAGQFRVYQKNLL